MPQKQFSQATPRDLMSAVRSALPMQRGVVGKEFAGTPVKWKLPLGDVSNYPRIIFSLSNGGADSGFGVVSGQISEEDAPLLSAAKEGEEFLVTAVIKTVTEFHISLDDVHLSLPDADLSLVDVSKDHGNPPAKTQTDEKGQEIIRPFHRRITNEQFGGGVLVIVVVEIILGATSHWNTLEVKFLLAVGVAWLSFWTYGEIRYKWNASKIKAGFAALLLAAILFGVAVLAYTSFDRPGAKPLHFSTVKPQEILAEVDKALPFQRNTVAQAFVGISVKWTMPLVSIRTFEWGDLAIFTADKGILPVVTAPVRNEDLPVLKIAKEGDVFIVTGTIKKVEIGIELEDASIISIGKQP